MLSLILRGIGFGFGAAVMPGPLQSYLISTSLSQGWRRAIYVVLGPLLADAPIILVMTFLLSQVPDEILDVIQIFGGVFVLWLAWGTWQSIRSNALEFSDEGETTNTSTRRILIQAATLTLLSPGPYIFWGSVTGPILREGLEQSLLHAAAFMMGFYVTFLGLWVMPWSLS